MQELLRAGGKAKASGPLPFSPSQPGSGANGQVGEFLPPFLLSEPHTQEAQIG